MIGSRPEAYLVDRGRPGAARSHKQLNKKENTDETNP